ncbi:Na+/H+ antiporter subunit A [Jonesia quinghaiensis]|uniref:Na+/H+ antiporter subunit A n=1 Tax=Jonesia quinghaiensis TaxID=262806 RepID=UPI00040EED7D|nr:Na+/H+ antiporter subunit A [Jonesia quinghaiensis]
MLQLLIFHAVLAVIAPLIVHRFGRQAFLVAALAPASAFVYALWSTPAVLAGNGPQSVIPWVPALGLEIALRMDTLSWLMLLIVSGVGVGVFIYCSAYFSRDASGLSRFTGVLTGFAGSMVGLVLADDLMLLFIFWELTTVFSYVLIGHYFDRKTSRRAAMQAIMVTTAGGLTMLVGIVILGVMSPGGFRISALLADPPSGGLITAAAVCLFVGAASKSALIPTHFWLPGAMAAPTPVSAYLHAAAMVKAGVYLIARFTPIFSTLTVWTWLVIVLGGGTLLLGGYRALRQHDLKLVLAYGTVSQLGLIILITGLGTQAAALAGVTMILGHALFKAALFLTIGVIDAATGTRDLRRLSGLGRAMPTVAVTGALATASMIGFPPFLGYVAKEAALEGLVHDGVPGQPSWVAILVIALITCGSILTVAYGARFVWGAFATKTRQSVIPIPATTADGSPAVTSLVRSEDITHPTWTLKAPGLVLAVLGLVVGVMPSAVEKYLASYAATSSVGDPGHLTLWAGFGIPFWLTLTILGLGAGLFFARRTVESFQAAVPNAQDTERAYRRFMRGLDNLAADITAFTQRGSLPYYLSVILLFMVLTVGSALVFTQGDMVAIKLWDSPAQALAVLVIIPAVIMVSRARRRLKAIVLMGFAGYSVAALFLLHGAPDLALTQVLVETVSIVVMVLVLRRLPPYFSDRPLKTSRFARFALASVVGLIAMGLAVTIPNARIHESVTVDYPQEAYEFGGGKNVVNVALVDMRAWDTVGEITVLLVAATGVASLIFLSRRSGDIYRLNQSPEVIESQQVWSSGSVPGPAAHAAQESFSELVTTTGATQLRSGARFRKWIRAGQTLAPQRRSIIFEVVARLLFHSMIIFALFLLFSGHNAPGGGFAAGLVVGIALIVRYLAGGRYELGEAAPVNAGVLLGLGLFLSAGVGLLGIVLGGEVLQSVIIEFTVPILGDIKFISTLFFDIGVFLLVIGLVLDVLRSLGAEIDTHIDSLGEEGARR